jgi:hypothetical protein
LFHFTYLLFVFLNLMIQCYSVFLLLRGFVLKTALQQIHLTSSNDRKIPQNVHLF